MEPIFKTNNFRNYTLRVAEEKDSQAIIHLLMNTAKWLESKGISQWEHLLTGEQNEEIIRDISNGVTYVIEDKNKIIATFNFSSEQNDWDIDMWGMLDDNAYYIHRLAIDRDYQNYQIGRNLLAWMHDNIQLENGYVRLDCIADNPVLNKFYQEAGFTFKKHVVMDEGRFSTYEKVY